MFPSYPEMPAFDVSPDGKLIAFTGRGEGELDLYFLNLQNHHVSLSQATPQAENEARFLNQETVLVIADETPKDMRTLSSLYAFDLRSKSFTKLLGREAHRYGLHCVISPEQVFFSEFEIKNRSTPFWQDIYGLQTGLYHMTIGTRKMVQSDVLDELQIVAYVFPDQKRLVFYGPSSKRSDRLSIRMAELSKPLNAKQTKIVKRTKLIDIGFEVAVSSDYRYLFYLSDELRIYEYEIYRYDLRSKEVVQLTRLGKSIQQLRCSADNKLYFIAIAEGKYDLWSIDFDGKNLKKVADYTLFDDPLNWKQKPNK